MSAKIENGASSETLTRERTWITELMNHPDVPQVSLATARVEPGITTELHRVAVAEWYVLIEGSGRMEVEGEAPFDVSAGDSVAIPAGASQRITNTGSSDLVFHCICTPRFTPRGYQFVEADHA